MSFFGRSWVWFFFFQAEDGIRDAQESRGLGDVYKRQTLRRQPFVQGIELRPYSADAGEPDPYRGAPGLRVCLLYTSDAADDLLCVDLGGRRIIKKKKERVSTSSFCLYNP